MLHHMAWSVKNQLPVAITTISTPWRAAWIGPFVMCMPSVLTLWNTPHMPVKLISIYQQSAKPEWLQELHLAKSKRAWRLSSEIWISTAALRVDLDEDEGQLQGRRPRPAARVLREHACGLVAMPQEEVPVRPVLLACLLCRQCTCPQAAEPQVIGKGARLKVASFGLAQPM